MTALAWIIAGMAAWPMIVVIAECQAGLRAPATSPPDPGPPPPFTVLIPAHDEAAGIAAVVAAVAAQLRPCDAMLVIADNCTDATACVAMQAGAPVARRYAPDRVGKAYALAFGRDILRAAPPAVVVMLDADCLPEPGALATLARTAATHDAAVQGRYLLGVPAGASPIVRLSAFAFLIRNRFRQRGLQRLGEMAVLQGSGMALPWRLFDTAPLVTASLVEDMKLGLDLALAGERVRFEDAAGFTGSAASQAATATQRTRWEQGMLATAAAYLPRLIAAGATRRARLLLLAADLSVPPLAMLAVFAAVVTCVLAVTGAVVPLLVLLGIGAVFAGTLATVWSRFGRALLPAPMLWRLPGYIIWKQPIYLRLVTGRELRWVRTSRLP